MNNALHGREAWCGPCERDRGRRRAARSRVLEAGIFGLRRSLARGNEADFQGLWFDASVEAEHLLLCGPGVGQSLGQV